MPPTITPHCKVTRAEIDGRQADLDKRDSSLNALLKSGGTIKWETHTFSTGKIQTFVSMFKANGARVRPLGKKGAGNTFISMPLVQTTLNRLTPKGAGHFVKLDAKSGRYKYALGFQKTDDEFFREDLFEDYKRCHDALTALYNYGLPEHFALGTNTEGIPITQCVPHVKAKWEEFKKVWLENAQKGAAREAMRAYKEENPDASKEDIKKVGSAAKKKVEFDEITARDDFRDDLIYKMADDDNKFLRAKNLGIVNADVLTINFDMRNDIKMPREVQPEDKDQYEAWKRYFEANKAKHEEDYDDQLAHLEKCFSFLENSLDGAFPLQFNTEFVINDSNGDPMTVQDANEFVEWSGALVATTIKLRAIDFKKVESIQTTSPVDLVNVQVEVNGRPRGGVAPIGSSVGCFGGDKPAAAAPAQAPMATDPPAAAAGDDSPKRTVSAAVGSGGSSPKKLKRDLEETE